MKRILILTILLMSSLAWAGSTTVVVGQGGGGPAGFCSGSELFCEDFEGDDTSWDATSGTVDCDGYDADGDYCDDETTTYKNGSEAFGIRGTNTYFVQEALSSADQTEFYFELWMRIASSTASFFDGAVGVFNDAERRIAVVFNLWGSLFFATKGGSTYPDTTYDISANTWTHIGVYYKMETGAANNDGIVRVWVNTDGGEFDVGDLVYSSTTVDTGHTTDSLGDGDEIVIQGPGSGYTHYIDDFKVTAGAPTWSYE